MKKLGDFLKYFLTFSFCLVAGIELFAHVIVPLIERANLEQVLVVAALICGAAYAAILTFVE